MARRLRLDIPFGTIRFRSYHYMYMPIRYRSIVDRAFPALIESAKRSLDLSLDLMPRLRLEANRDGGSDGVPSISFANVAENRAVE